MTLDEAIEHEEELAKINQRVVDTGIVFDDVTIDMLYCDDTEVIEEHLANYQRCAEEHKQISEWLKELKRLKEQEPKWIPVSERLPMEFEFVNCTCHSLIDDREDWVVETVYIPQPSDSPYSDWGNIPMLNSGDCEVVAWVHRDIPKPYKAESEDKE